MNQKEIICICVHQTLLILTDWLYVNVYLGGGHIHATCLRYVAIMSILQIVQIPFNMTIDVDHSITHFELAKTMRHNWFAGTQPPQLKIYSWGLLWISNHLCMPLPCLPFAFTFNVSLKPHKWCTYTNQWML